MNGKESGARAGAVERNSNRSGPVPTIRLAFHEVSRLRQRALVLEHLASSVLSDFATITGPTKLLLRFAGMGSFEADARVIAEIAAELRSRAADARTGVTDVLAVAIPGESNRSRPPRTASRRYVGPYFRLQ